MHKQKLIHFKLFSSFFLHVSHILGDFCDLFPLFLAQNFKTIVLTGHKNLLLECLVTTKHTVLRRCHAQTELIWKIIPYGKKYSKNILPCSFIDS